MAWACRDCGCSAGAAVGRLAGGASVTRVALELGYDSPSAFSAMFRRVLDATPSALARSLA